MHPVGDYRTAFAQRAERDSITFRMSDITSTAHQASGRFLLRLPPGLHEALRGAAAAAGLSLNDYCARKLTAPLGDISVIDGGAHAVTHAASLFGDHLVGIAVFGSWARQEASAGSDVDLLIVVDPVIEITRKLYRQWDQTAEAWDGHMVEPHFVQLAAPDAIVAGLWAEVALDGIVLFERDLTLSRRLAQVRRNMLAGRIVRRTVHGQPYWTEAA